MYIISVSSLSCTLMDQYVFFHILKMYMTYYKSGYLCYTIFKVDVVIRSNIQGFPPHHTNKKLEVMTDFNLVTTIIRKQEKEITFMNSH